MYECLKCGFYSLNPLIRCPKCNSIIHYKHGFKWIIDGKYPGIWKFREQLPRFKIMNSLNEGFTPLIKSSRLSKELGIHNLYFKDEGRNPTGSFRDRVAALLTSHAYSLGFKKLICATDGNTGASLAAYSSRLGLRVKAIVPRGSDWGKIILMRSFGAEVIEHGESLDDVYSLADKISLEENLYNATSESNALSIEALKTISYEIYIDLKKVPDCIFVPIGSGLTLYSIFHGFIELLEHRIIKCLPRLIGVETCWNPKISKAMGLEARLCNMKPVIGLAYKYPPLEREVIQAIKQTNGFPIIVDWKNIMFAGELLAKYEGLFVEPAAASALAGYVKAVREEFVEKDSTSIILLTGHGLKAIESYSSGRIKAKGLPKKVFGGDTKLEIIRLLYSVGELHGYSIWKELGIKISVQAVYQHLNELEKRGILVSRIIGGKKYYSLSNKGLRIANLLDELYELLRS